MAPDPEQAFFEQLLHVHQAEDAFWHEVEEADEDDEPRFDLAHHSPT